MYRAFWWRNWKEGDYLQKPGVDSRTILKLIFKKQDGVMDWIHLAQYRDGRQAVVNALMNI